MGARQGSEQTQSFDAVGGEWGAALRPHVQRYGQASTAEMLEHEQLALRVSHRRAAFQEIVPGRAHEVEGATHRVRRRDVGG